MLFFLPFRQGSLKVYTYSFSLRHANAEEVWLQSIHVETVYTILLLLVLFNYFNNAPVYARAH